MKLGLREVMPLADECQRRYVRPPGTAVKVRSRVRGASARYRRAPWG